MLFKNIFLFSVMSLSMSVRAQVFDWMTIAGSIGTIGASDGISTNALFANPQGIAVDSGGNVFVADQDNSVIRKISLVSSNWQVETIAGSPGIAGASDGTGGAALFNNPQGIAVDSSGNMFVADTANSTIRKILSVGGNWMVTTIAGQSGVNISRDGTNSNAGFKYPCGITTDASGNIYVADTQGFSIRKLIHSGSDWVVTTLAGKANSSGYKDGSNSVARFQAPFGIAVQANGTIFISDGGSCNIRKISNSGTNWVVTTIAGANGIYSFVDGTNTAALFNFPQGIATDVAGNLYVADTGNNTIRKLSLQGTNWVTTTVAAESEDPSVFSPAVSGGDDGVAGAAHFNRPTGICLTTNGLIFVSDTFNYTVRQAYPMPVIQYVSLAGSQVNVSWSAVSGLNYQLQYTTALNPAAWTNSGATQQATNSILTFADTPGGDTQRFYRVSVVP